MSKKGCSRFRKQNFVKYNKNKYFISPNGITIYAEQGKDHYETAEKIVIDNIYLLDLYNKIKNDEIVYMSFLLLFGYIAVDKKYGEEMVEYCRDSIDKINEKKLRKLIGTTEAAKGVVHDVCLELDSNGIAILQEILEYKKQNINLISKNR